MRTSDFEFRHRFWIISAIFFVAFFSYQFDHRNVVEALLRGVTSATSHDFVTRRCYQIAFGIAALTVFAAAALRAWAASYLRSTVVHDTALHSDVLVADGPFRHLRNPLYLGTILLAVGVGAAASVTGFFILVCGTTLFVYRLILREEAELAGAHSESYLLYRKRVPRLLPSPWPRVPASGCRPQWRQGLRGESMIWLFALAMAGFALTLNVVVLNISFAVALGVGYLVSYSTRRKSTKVSAASSR